ncbi:MAG: GtrA family protein [Synergistaceae bacterium]|jgi:putative flippase GtrA|nr:GtrA family protein [Synergistaceae bacterium]
MLKAMLINPSDNSWILFFRYCVLGGIAFFIDASILYLLTENGVYYIISSAVSFVIVLIIHFVISKNFVFKECKMPLRAEIFFYSVIALAGLALTEACMYFFTDVAGIYYLFSKVITTFIVLIWNFASRKLWLYRK